MNAPALLATYQLRQREYLLRITRAMTSRLDLPSLLKLILNSAAEMVGCRAGLIVLLPEDSEFGRPPASRTRFQVRAIYGIPPQSLPVFEPLLEIPPVVQEAADADEPGATPFDPYVLDLQTRVRQLEEKLGVTLGQVVGLPLLVEDDLLGIIYLFRGEYAFTQLDWQFLQGFADQAAIAVRNARLYHQLERERSRLAAVIENSADGILILDSERRVVVINQTFSDIVGLSSEEVAGLPCQDVLPLENVIGDDVCQAEATPSFSGQPDLRCEGDLIRPNKKRITAAVTYTPLYDDAGHLVNIIVNVHDITRFREEEEIKSTFTSIISHELKTPVALIKGYAQTLARPDARWDSETARSSLQIIEEEADRLEALINNLLDVSRIQAGGLRLDFADVNLQNLVNRVAEGYRTQTERHTIQVDFPAPLPTIWADEERVRQILTNLVANAIKYSPDGGLIRIGGWSDTMEGTPRAVLYVADQGVGIPADELPHIFNPFYRVDSSLRRTTAGAGLGLFLGKAIAEAHGGDIWVRSEPGKGATFFVALPVEPRIPLAESVGLSPRGASAGVRP